MSQRDFVLQRLREAGPRGIHTFQLRKEYVGNPSQRIAELEALGYVIQSVRERPAPDRALGARYTLVRDADVGQSNHGLTAPEVPSVDPPTVVALAGAGRAAAAGSVPPGAGGTLFDPTTYQEETARWAA